MASPIFAPVTDDVLRAAGFMPLSDTPSGVDLSKKPRMKAGFYTPDEMRAAFETHEPAPGQSAVEMVDPARGPGFMVEETPEPGFAEAAWETAKALPAQAFVGALKIAPGVLGAIADPSERLAKAVLPEPVGMIASAPARFVKEQAQEMIAGLDESAAANQPRIYSKPLSEAKPESITARVGEVYEKEGGGVTGAVKALGKGVLDAINQSAALAGQAWAGASLGRAIQTSRAGAWLPEVAPSTAKALGAAAGLAGAGNVEQQIRYGDKYRPWLGALETAATIGLLLTPFGRMFGASVKPFARKFVEDFGANFFTGLALSATGHMLAQEGGDAGERFNSLVESSPDKAREALDMALSLVPLQLVHAYTGAKENSKAANEELFRETPANEAVKVARMSPEFRREANRAVADAVKSGATPEAAEAVILAEIQNQILERQRAMLASGMKLGERAMRFLRSVDDTAPRTPEEQAALSAWLGENLPSDLGAVPLTPPPLPPGVTVPALEPVTLAPLDIPLGPARQERLEAGLLAERAAFRREQERLAAERDAAERARAERARLAADTVDEALRNTEPPAPIEPAPPDPLAERLGPDVAARLRAAVAPPPAPEPAPVERPRRGEDAGQLRLGSGLGGLDPASIQRGVQHAKRWALSAMDTLAKWNLKGAVTTAEAVKKFLSSGVSMDELKYAAPELLLQQQRKWTKADLAKAFREAGFVERTLGGPPLDAGSRARMESELSVAERDLAEKHGQARSRYGEFNTTWPPEVRAELEALGAHINQLRRDLRGDVPDERKTRHKSYQLPGESKNYEEHLFYFEPDPKVFERQAKLREELSRIHSELLGRAGEPTTRTPAETKALEDRFARVSDELDKVNKEAAIAEYQAPEIHYPDELGRNLLFHFRISERTLPDGRRILLIEEIQSDFHQNPDGEPRPDAPLRDTWHEKAFLRAMQIAAERGLDGIAWTTGDQQIDRYRNLLSSTADRITITPMREYPIVPRQYVDRKGKVTTGPTGEVVVRVYQGGNEIEKRVVNVAQMQGNRQTALPDLLGKKVTRQVLADPTAETEYNTPEQIQSILDDSWQRGFYDAKLGGVADRVGRLTGAKRGMVELMGPTVDPLSTAGGQRIESIYRTFDLESPAGRGSLAEMLRDTENVTPLTYTMPQVVRDVMLRDIESGVNMAKRENRERYAKAWLMAEGKPVAGQPKYPVHFLPITDVACTKLARGISQYSRSNDIRLGSGLGGFDPGEAVRRFREAFPGASKALEGLADFIPRIRRDPVSDETYARFRAALERAGVKGAEMVENPPPLPDPLLKPGTPGYAPQKGRGGINPNQMLAEVHDFDFSKAAETARYATRVMMGWDAKVGERPVIPNDESLKAGERIANEIIRAGKQEGLQKFGEAMGAKSTAEKYAALGTAAISDVRDFVENHKRLYAPIAEGKGDPNAALDYALRLATTEGFYNSFDGATSNIARMLQMRGALQREVASGRYGTDALRTEFARRALEKLGGMKLVQAKAQLINNLLATNPDDPVALIKGIRGLKDVSTMDHLVAYAIANAIAVKANVANILGNVLRGMYQVAGVSPAVDVKNAVTTLSLKPLGVTAARLHGYLLPAWRTATSIEGMKSALRHCVDIVSERIVDEGKIEHGDTGLPDFGPVPIGRASRFFINNLVAMDAGFKAMAGTAAIHEGAWIEAYAAEAAAKRAGLPFDIKAFALDRIRNPSPETVARIDQYQRELTGQTELKDLGMIGAAASGLQYALRKAPLFRLVQMFIRFPANALAFSFDSTLGLPVNLAKTYTAKRLALGVMDAVWGNAKERIAELEAEGKATTWEKQRAIEEKIMLGVLGMGLFSLGWMHHKSGNATPPALSKEDETRYRYSPLGGSGRVRIGNGYTETERMDPTMAPYLLGVSASAASEEEIRKARERGEKWAKVGGAMPPASIAAIPVQAARSAVRIFGRMALTESFFSGIRNIMDVFDAPSDTMEEKLFKAVRGIGGNFVPFGAAINEATQWLGEPEGAERDVNARLRTRGYGAAVEDFLRSRVGWFRGGRAALTKKYDPAFGQPLSVEKQRNPFGIGALNADPLDAVIYRLGGKIPQMIDAGWRGLGLRGEVGPNGEPSEIDFANQVRGKVVRDMLGWIMKSGVLTRRTEDEQRKILDAIFERAANKAEAAIIANRRAAGLIPSPPPPLVPPLPGGAGAAQPAPPRDLPRQ